MKILSLALLFMTISSCGFIHYTSTKSEGERSRAEIDNWLNEHDYKWFDHSLELDDAKIDSFSVRRHALNLWKLEHGKPQSTMQMRIYDSIGKLVTAYDVCFGNFRKLNILSEEKFVIFSHLPVNYDLRFEDELRLWKAAQAEKEKISQQSKQRENTVIIYWNIWSNYYSKVMMRELKRYFRRYGNRETLLIIFVNTDFNIDPKD